MVRYIHPLIKIKANMDRVIECNLVTYNKDVYSAFQLFVIPVFREIFEQAFAQLYFDISLVI